MSILLMKKTPIKQEFCSLHKWHTNMKPFTDNCKEDNGLPIVDIILSF